ncbi:MAG: hypothetical protein LBC27_01640 [Spirochaetaceae bacterium]|jgi:hypothetical protein|nr:hypothetical protein [Spirochaetaceae bacterium]
MKKSLINYGIPIALVLAALLTGCSQPTDDDDSGGGGNVPRYDEIRAVDVYSIAAAFDAGQNPVFVEKDISLGDQELVIPTGKTLDFVANKRTLTANGIGQYAKIILAGDINLVNGENYITLDGEHQKFITTLANLEKYAEVKDLSYASHQETDPGYYPFPTVPDFRDDSKKFKVYADNVVIIQEWTSGLENDFLALAGSASVYYDGYLALEVPSVGDGYASPSALEIIGKYTDQLRIYILNSVKFPDAVIDLGAGGGVIPPAYIPVRSSSYNSLRSISGPDPDGEIVIAGGLYLNRSRVLLVNNSTETGPTNVVMAIKGPISGLSDDTSGRVLITGGSVTVYNANFADTNRTVFQTGKIDFIAELGNKFGDTVEFRGEGPVRVNGPSVIKQAEFNGETILGGKVTTKAGASLIFKAMGSKIYGGLDLAPNTAITANGITITGNITGDAQSWETIVKDPKIDTTNTDDNTGAPPPPAPSPDLETIILTKANFNAGGQYINGVDNVLNLGAVNIVIDATGMNDKIIFTKGAVLQGGLGIRANPNNIPIKVENGDNGVIVNTNGTIDNSAIDFSQVTTWKFQAKFPQFVKAVTFDDVTSVTIGTEGELATVEVASDVSLSFENADALTVNQPVKFTTSTAAGIEVTLSSTANTFEEDVTFGSGVTAVVPDGVTITISGDDVAFNGPLSIGSASIVDIANAKAPVLGDVSITGYGSLSASAAKKIGLIGTTGTGIFIEAGVDDVDFNVSSDNLTVTSGVLPLGTNDINLSSVASLVLNGGASLSFDESGSGGVKANVYSIGIAGTAGALKTINGVKFTAGSIGAAVEAEVPTLTFGTDGPFLNVKNNAPKGQELTLANAIIDITAGGSITFDATSALHITGVGSLVTVGGSLAYSGYIASSKIGAGGDIPGGSLFAGTSGVDAYMDIGTAAANFITSTDNFGILSSLNYNITNLFNGGDIGNGGGAGESGSIAVFKEAQ